MDFFGIGQAVVGALGIYFRSARGTGRTKLMIDNIKENDILVFLQPQEADRVQRLLRDKGIQAVCTTSPADLRNILDKRNGMKPGRVVLDHSWLEDYYIGVLVRAHKDLSLLDERPHVEEELTPFIDTKKWVY